MMYYLSNDVDFHTNSTIKQCVQSMGVFLSCLSSNPTSSEISNKMDKCFLINIIIIQELVIFFFFFFPSLKN